MKKPVIAVDIDEVLAQHNASLVRFHNERYGTSHTLEDYISDYWSEVWKIDKVETERRAVEFHETGAHGNLEVVDGALESLKHLQQRFHLVAVTVRRKSTVESTYQWLDMYFPEIFSDVRFIHSWDDPDTTLTKADVCDELGAGWLIDDSVRHCRLMAETGKVGILFGNYPWNQQTELPEGVVRLKDWGEVKEYFDAS